MNMDKPAYSYRVDETVPDFADTGPCTVMDAHCSLCARGAKWIAHNDHKKEFRIIPLQSILGNALMVHYGLNPEDPSSWLFIESGRAYSSLEAFVKVATRLGGVWKIFCILRIIPKHVQDYLYRAIAQNRYRIFGRADLCNIPDPEVRKRILT